MRIWYKVNIQHVKKQCKWKFIHLIRINKRIKNTNMITTVKKQDNNMNKYTQKIKKIAISSLRNKHIVLR